MSLTQITIARGQDLSQRIEMVKSYDLAVIELQNLTAAEIQLRFNEQDQLNNLNLVINITMRNTICTNENSLAIGPRTTRAADRESTEPVFIINQLRRMLHTLKQTLDTHSESQLAHHTALDGVHTSLVNRIHGLWDLGNANYNATVALNEQLTTSVLQTCEHLVDEFRCPNCIMEVTSCPSRNLTCNCPNVTYPFCEALKRPYLMNEILTEELSTLIYGYTTMIAAIINLILSCTLILLSIKRKCKLKRKYKVEKILATAATYGINLNNRADALLNPIEKMHFLPANTPVKLDWNRTKQAVVGK